MLRIETERREVVDADLRALQVYRKQKMGYLEKVCLLSATGEKIQAVKVLVKLIWLYQIVLTAHFL